MIKAILSDAGSILFDDKGFAKKVYNELSGITGKLQEQLREEFKPYKLRAYTDKKYSYERAWNDFCDEQNLTLKQKREIREIYKNQWKPAELYSEVKETIDKLLERKIAFIILTDSPEKSEKMKKWLNEQQLYVTGIISSKDIGVTKPDKRFFDTALETYGLKQEETAFLGHDYDELRGAYDLGFRVLALNYKEEDAMFLPEENKLRRFSDLIKAQEQTSS